MDKKVHICNGSCKAVVSDEEFKSGSTNCGAKDCNLYGESFTEAFQCETCNEVYPASETHTH